MSFQQHCEEYVFTCIFTDKGTEAQMAKWPAEITQQEKLESKPSRSEKVRREKCCSGLEDAGLLIISQSLDYIFKVCKALKKL